MAQRGGDEAVIADRPLYSLERLGRTEGGIPDEIDGAMIAEQDVVVVITGNCIPALSSEEIEEGAVEPVPDQRGSTSAIYSNLPPEERPEVGPRKELPPQFRRLGARFGVSFCR